MERIKKILEKISGAIEPGDLDELFHALGKAQNRPPLGEADGSVSAEDWAIANDAARHLNDGWHRTRRFLR